MEVTSDKEINDQEVIKAVQNAGYGASIYQNEYLEKQNKKVKGKQIKFKCGRPGYESRWQKG